MSKTVKVQATSCLAKTTSTESQTPGHAARQVSSASFFTFRANVQPSRRQCSVASDTVYAGTSTSLMACSLTRRTPALL